MRALKGHGRSADELWRKLVQQRKSGTNSGSPYSERPDAGVSSKGKEKEPLLSPILESASSEPPADVPKSGNPSTLARINSLRVFSDSIPSDISVACTSQPSPILVASSISGAARLHPFSQAASSNVPNPPPELLEASGIFSGVTFAALGEANANEAMKEEIRSRDGVFLDISEGNPQLALQKADIVVVRLERSGLPRIHLPHVLMTLWIMDSASKYAQIQTHHAQIRTECWFEQCIFEERMVPPKDHITFQPIVVPLPIAGEIARQKLFLPR